MPNTLATKSELETILDQVEDLACDALDPELAREDVVAKVKEIYDLVSPDDNDDEDDDTGNGDEDGDDDDLD